MHKRNLTEELVKDVEQIEDNALLFRQGRNSAYQTVAIQLRNLLLKGRRALVSQVFPNADFHPLNAPSHESSMPEPGGRVVLFSARGRLALKTGAPAQLHLEFDERQPKLRLNPWLDQWILRPDITLRRLIEDMANEEVAHTQEAVSPVLEKARDFIVQSGPYRRHPAEMAVVALGEYVAARLRDLLAAREADGRAS